MNSRESKLCLILLIIILIFSILMIIKIKREPKYNEILYGEIYNQYNEVIKSEINENYIAEFNKTTNKKKETYVIEDENKNKYKIIGEINIPKIGVSYPIIYKTTDEYLKIAPTKLFGPDMHEVGNLCILGHNYKNENFFSRLNELEKNDNIILTDNNRKKIIYKIFDKLEVREDDLSCTNQNTNGNIEVTLITCTKKKSNRLVVKCRADIKEKKVQEI